MDPTARVLALQRTIGNRATGRVLQRICEGQHCPPAASPTLRPQDCTWSEWIGSFAALQTFESHDGVGSDLAAYDAYRQRHHRGRRLKPDDSPHTATFTVLGDAPAHRGDESPGSGPSDAPAPYAGTVLRNTPFGDEFIDHPTERWLCCHLPPDLIHLVYQLPVDCADVATVLRHVWLVAHGESEQRVINGRTVILGRGASDAQVERELIAPIDSWSMPRLLDPIVDSGHRPIRSFAALRTQLRPGDVLVWAHYSHVDRHGRPVAQNGGHVQTVMSVTGGRVTALEGDMPLFGPQIKRLAITRGLTAAQQSQLHNTPGRRIQTETYDPAQQHDDHWGIWTWSDDLLNADGRYRAPTAGDVITRLVIAGRWPEGSEQRGAEARRLQRQTHGATRQFSVVLTGFEPWSEHGRTPPRNPSGEIALALNGHRETLPDGTVMVIQSLVFPVNRARFDAGIVETRLGPLLPTTDAVISMGLNPDATPGSDIQLENVAADVAADRSRHTIRALPGGTTSSDPPVLTDNRDLLERLQAPGRSAHAAVTVRLASAAAAKALAADMQREQPGAIVARTGRRLEISGGPAVDFLLTHIHWTPGAGTHGTIRLGGHERRLTVTEGSGGDFYCNEVLYRVLRLLNARHAQAAERSFFIHLPSDSPTGAPHQIDPRLRRQNYTSVLDTIRQVAGEQRRTPSAE